MKTYILLVTVVLPAMLSSQFIGGGGGVGLPGVVTPQPPVTINVAPATAPVANGVSNTNTNTNTNNNQYFNGFFNSHNLNTGYGVNTHVSSDNCPQQTDFSADLLLSSDPTGYPLTAINTELANRPDLLNCLAREVVLPTAPKVPVDHVLSSAINTCPSSNPMLWSFFRYNGRCWIVQNVQEMINYTICGTVRCQKCDNFFSSSGSETRCLRQFQYFSVWAFCEGLPALQQISRERVILPVACTCQKIRCFAKNFFWK